MPFILNSKIGQVVLRLGVQGDEKLLTLPGHHAWFAMAGHTLLGIWCWVTGCPGNHPPQKTVVLDSLRASSDLYLTYRSLHFLSLAFAAVHHTTTRANAFWSTMMCSGWKMVKCSRLSTHNTAQTHSVTTNLPARHDQTIQFPQSLRCNCPMCTYVCDETTKKKPQNFFALP